MQSELSEGKPETSRHSPATHPLTPKGALGAVAASDFYLFGIVSLPLLSYFNALMQSPERNATMFSTIWD